MEKEYKYMVRTYCRTYNQERYILDALNGFAMQETSFPVVTTIVEDCSTDSTAGVIRKYLSDNFCLNDSTNSFHRETDYAHIVYAKHKSNPSCFFAVLFLKYNHYRERLDVFHYISEWTDKSKYLAICEGDDYWTDPLKLQKQVDFLEEHEDVMVCFHATSVLIQSTGEFVVDYNVVDMPGKSSMFDLLKVGNYVQTASAMFRKDDRVEEDMKKIRGTPIGDYPRWVLCAKYGNLYKLPDNMAVYRFGDGSWQSKSRIYQNVHLLNLLNRLRMVVGDKTAIEIIDDRIRIVSSEVVDLE